MKKKRWNYDVIKRIIDITISGLALIILIPLVLVVAILIKVESPGLVLLQCASNPSIVLANMRWK